MVKKTQKKQSGGHLKSLTILIWICIHSLTNNSVEELDHNSKEMLKSALTLMTRPLIKQIVKDKRISKAVKLIITKTGYNYQKITRIHLPNSEIEFICPPFYNLARKEFKQVKKDQYLSTSGLLEAVKNDKHPEDIEAIKKIIQKYVQKYGREVHDYYLLSTSSNNSNEMSRKSSRKSSRRSSRKSSRRNYNN